MPKVKVNDINMYYEIHGEGEPLAMIMGYTGDLTRWSRILPYLTKEYKLILFDNRGIGQTDKPDIPYTFKMMADDLAGLLDAISIKAAHIFGVSMGGGIAQHLALDYPEKVISLILGCTSPGGPNSVSSEDALSTISPEISQALSPEESVRSMLSIGFTKKFIENNPTFIEELVAQRIQNPPNSIGRARQYEAINTHDTYERLSDIKTPTLVVAGDEDVLVNPENSHILASRIPNSKLVILKELGHSFILEAPEKSSKVIIDFLKQK